MRTMRLRSFVMRATVAMMILGWSLPASAQDPALRQELDQLKHTLNPQLGAMTS